MLEAALWGLIGASSLLAGALAGYFLGDRIPSKAIGLILGFGAGTLISALAFELTQEAFELGGADAVALGLAAGALAYYLGSRAIDARGGADRMSHMGTGGQGASTALLLGAVLDGIPESAVIGITLLEGGSVGFAVLAAVFLSNLPEGLSSASGMRRDGRSSGYVVGVWCTVVLVCGLSSALGFGLLDGASGNTIALIQAFAGGAVLTMLAETMVPEAHEHGGAEVGLFTVLGFALAFLLSTM
jgi:ZIP family zinc transporter